MVDFPSKIRVQCHKVVHHGDYTLSDRLGKVLLGFLTGPGSIEGFAGAHC